MISADRQQRTPPGTHPRYLLHTRQIWVAYGEKRERGNHAYNARDQITQSNQAGQIRSFGYDGHGRLQTHTTPELG